MNRSWWKLFNFFFFFRPAARFYERYDEMPLRLRKNNGHGRVLEDNRTIAASLLCSGSAVHVEISGTLCFFVCVFVCG